MRSPRPHLGDSPSLAVDIEATAPRLWRLLPRAQREEVACISRLLSTTQEFANAGFPEGTNHGLSHIAGVLRRADELVSQLKVADFNGVEAYLLLLAVLLHDSALLRGREGHADPTRILEVINTLQLPIEYTLRALVARIAASHSGYGRIEELPEYPVLVSATMQKADLRAIAAVLRLSDEVAEDAVRTSPVAVKNALPRSIPFHEFSAAAVCGFEISNGLGSILIQLTCDESKLSALIGEPGRTLLSYFLDRCVKIETERQYCSRFMPKGIRLDSTRLRILDTLSSRPWIESIVPGNSKNLRSLVYSAKPRILFPSLNYNNGSSLENDLKLSLKECLGGALVSIVGTETVYWAIMDGDSIPPVGTLLDLISTQLRSLHQVPVLIRELNLRQLFAEISLGVPEILRMARQGNCLLASSTYDVARRIADQPLRFSKAELTEHLAAEGASALEQVEKAKSLLEQVYNCHRMIMVIGQSVIIANSKNPLPGSTLFSLSEPKSLSRRLKAAGISPELRASFARVHRVFATLMNGKGKADSDPQEAYLDIAYSWCSLVDALTEGKV